MPYLLPHRPSASFVFGPCWAAGQAAKNKRPPPVPPSKLAPWYPAATAMGVAVALALLAKGDDSICPPVKFCAEEAPLSRCSCDLALQL